MMGNRANDKVEIAGEKYLKYTLELLTGERGCTDLDEQYLPVARAMDHPDELPFLVNTLYEMEDTEHLRLALVRLQVDCDLKMHMDLNFYQRRLYVAQTIERIIFGSLLLEGGSGEDDDTDEEGNPLGKCKR